MRKRRSLLVVTALTSVLAVSGVTLATPIRLDYVITDLGGGLFDYEFTLVLDNNNNSWQAGQSWDWLIWGDQQSARTNLTDWVGDESDLPVGPWTEYTSSSGFHNGPTFLDFPDFIGWEPQFIGDSLSWSGTSTAFLDQGELLWSTLLGNGGAKLATFEVANLIPAPATLSLLALAGLGLRRRRRRR